MFHKNNQEKTLSILDIKIDLKKRELRLVEQEILLREKLSDVSKFAQIIEENNFLRQRNEKLEIDIKQCWRMIECSIMNGTNLVDKMR